MDNVEDKQASEKATWKKPELIGYGSVEKITLKGFGVNDGSGLKPVGTHPSM